MSETTRLLGEWYDGDRTALDALLEMHMGNLQTMVRKKLGSVIRKKEESGDILQEAAIKFLKYGPRVRLANENDFLGLLLKIVENVIRDRYDYYTRYRRAQDREQALSSQCTLDLETPGKVVTRGEEQQWVRLGLEFLDQDKRVVLVLRQWESLSWNEIATQLGLNPNTARDRYDRGVKRLAGIVARLRKGEIGALLEESGCLSEVA